MKKTLRIALITTRQTNVGDDFIRDGLIYLLKSTIERKIKFYYINKHKPETASFIIETLLKYKIIQFFNHKFFNWIPNKISCSDLTIISGAPVYWIHPGHTICSNNEWYKPLIKNIVQKKGVILFNIGGGTSQEYYSEGDEFFNDNEVISYIKELHSTSKITIVRDSLSAEVLEKMGLDRFLLACPSIFVKEKYQFTNAKEYIVLNYMKGGGHYDFSNTIDFKKWEHTFKNFYNSIKMTNKNIVFVCHNLEEVNNAREFDKDANIFYSKNYVKYFEFYSKARFGIVNRVHSAFVMASYESPSIIIGSDSRAKMAEMIGLKSFFVNDIDSHLLKNEFDRLLNDNSYHLTIKEIKQKTFINYKEILSNVIKDI